MAVQINGLEQSNAQLVGRLAAAQSANDGILSNAREAEASKADLATRQQQLQYAQKIQVQHRACPAQPTKHLP